MNNVKNISVYNLHYRFIGQSVANGLSTGLNDRSRIIINLSNTWNNVAVLANDTTVFTNVDLAGTYGKEVPVKHRIIIEVNNIME